MTDGIEGLVTGLGKAVADLTLVAGELKAIEGGLAQLGWAPPPGVNLVALMTLDVTNVLSALEQLAASTPEERADTATMASRIAALGLALAEFGKQAADFAADLPAELSAVGDYATVTGIAGQLPRRLLDFLVMRQAAAGAPLLYSLLKLAGVFTAEHLDADPAIYQVEHVRATVHWGRLPMLITSPGGLATSVYGWGTAGFDAERLLLNISDVLERLGARSRLRKMEPWLEAALTGRPAPPEATTDPNPQLVAEVLAMAGVNVTLSLHRQRASTPGGADGGLELVPVVIGGTTIDVPLNTVLALLLEAEIELDGGIALGLRPGSPPALRSGVGSGQPGDLKARAGLGLRVGGPPPGDPLLLLRLGDGGRLDVQQVRLLAGASLDSDGVDAYVRLELDQLRLLIGTRAADGFVGSKLPADGSGLTVDLRVLWSQRQGLRVEGAARLEIVLPVNKTLGFISIASVRLAASAGTGQDALVLEAAVTGGLALGPVSLSVDDVGLRARLVPGAGNLGPLGLEAGFKPPKGMGALIKAGPVTGGGYIFFDQDNEQYAGLLQLSFKTITLTAIGLLTTRLPDPAGAQGATRKGFSLLVIIAAEFPPIQLGYGFTLNGAGGLLGINRTMVIDALRNGVRDGSVNAILFPKDPVARAPQIIGQLRAIFPPAEGRYVFGPMVKIGWGPNSLLEFEAALVLELLAPIRLVVLGRIQVGLPDKKSPVLKLRLDIVGVVDFDRGEVSVDASLIDSKIAGFSITGDMSLRAGWAATRGFALAAGGFHPRFQPPAGFPPLRRLAISLADSDNPRLRLESYLALTSNTIQFGALLDIYAKADTFAGTFSVAANIGFDALIQFVPFALMADLGASVDIAHNGTPFLHAALHASLTGPGPWHAVGYAEFDFFGRHRIDVEVTAGAPAPQPLAQIAPADVFNQLVNAFSTADAWVTLPPADGDKVVSVRDQGTGAGLPVHPLGSVRAHQRLIPLGLAVNRFGDAEVPSVTFGVRGLRIGAGAGTQPGRADLYDDFAPGLFTALTDDERLARPAFESMRSGAVAPFPGFRAPADLPGGVAGDGGYEEALVDTEPETGVRSATPVPGAGASLPAGYLTGLSQGGAAAHAQTRATGDAEFTGPDLGVTVTAERYVVADTGTLTPVPGAGPTSAAEAHGQLRAQPAGAGPAAVALAHEAG